MSSAELQAWVDTGAQLLVELTPGRPKSLSIDAIPSGPVGRDAPLVRAVAGDVEFAGTVVDAARSRGGDRALQASTSVLRSYLRSGRFREVVQWGTPGQRAMTAEEVFYLQRLRRNAGSAIDDGFIAELGRPRLADALRQALIDLDVQLHEVTAIDAELLAVASYKTVFRVSVRRSGSADPVTLAVKLGRIDPAEVELLSRLAEGGLAARPLSPVLERANGLEAIVIEEFVAGREPGSVWLQSVLSGAPDLTIARAIGDWDARAWLHTSGGTGTGYYNADWHLANFIQEAPGGLKCVDADPRFGGSVSERLYFAASLARRNVHDDARFGLGVYGFDAYLQGVVRVLRADLGDARMREIVARARDDLRDPTMRAQVIDVQDRAKLAGAQIVDFNPVEFAADAARTADAIEAFLRDLP
jgi:hypothetical protein